MRRAHLLSCTHPSYSFKRVSNGWEGRCLAGADGGELLVWLLPTGGCTPPLPATSAQDGAIVGEEWCVYCTPAAHPPRILHPMRGMKNGGRGSVGASWLAISGRQVPRLTPRKVNCRLKESKLPTEESKLPTGKVNCRLRKVNCRLRKVYFPSVGSLLSMSDL